MPHNPLPAAPSSARQSPDILVLGVGNPLMGDDGAGSRVIELLAEKNLPPNVCIKDAGLPGWGLPSWFENHATVILVDAMDMQQQPGAWRRFRPEEVRMEMEQDSLSLHQSGLAAGLALAQALDLLPANLILYGIQPADLTPGAALGPEISRSLPQVIESLMKDIEAA